ncbi:Phosphoribosyl transferase domain [Musa troglodytarum]|uniref:adenine phosphoribosyltransferase n=1 Tax=Musa troglodytarum TaxID=320322 RepID=A0A9E7F482_9LILI|nr:Phosphoribosyl transferase domain [Musa troglodytarum]
MAVCEDKEQDPRIRRIASSIRVVPDFPKKGIMFQDITTLLLDPKAFKDTADLFVERYTGKGISVVAGEFLDHLVFGSSAMSALSSSPFCDASVSVPRPSSH